MTNRAKYSLFCSKAFLSLPGNRFGFVSGQNSSMNESLAGAPQFCLSARMRHGVQASRWNRFELLEYAADNHRVREQPRTIHADAEQLAVNGGGN
jgi:hypothetical protein